MYNIFLIIFIVMMITSPFGLTQLRIKYGMSWKFKDLSPFYKGIFIYLCTVIVFWACFVVYTVISISIH